MYILNYENKTEYFKTKREAETRAEIIILTQNIRQTPEMYKEEQMHTNNLTKRTYYKRIGKHKWIKEN